MPNPLQEIWLEARCNRDAMTDKRVCDVCQFSNLMGTVDEEIPQWLNMWGSGAISGVEITEANKKIIMTSSAIAHMFPDKIGYNEKLVEENAAEKRKVIIKRRSAVAAPAAFTEFPQPFPYSFEECFKNPQQCIAKEPMSDKKRGGPPKKKPIPLEPEAAIVMKSHAACITVHYVESHMEPIEVAEVIYKRVKKELVDIDGKDILCYNDNGVYYECGPNGEIKGRIEISSN